MLKNIKHFFQLDWKKNKSKLRCIFNICNFVVWFFQVSVVRYEFCVILQSVVWETNLNRSEVTWEGYKIKNGIKNFSIHFLRKLHVLKTAVFGTWFENPEKAERYCPISDTFKTKKLLILWKNLFWATYIRVHFSRWSLNFELYEYRLWWKKCN